LLPQGDPFRRFYAQQLQQCDRFLLLEDRLSAILQGEARLGDAAECLELIGVCRLKQQYATAARFCARAFAAEPKLAEDLRTSLRYDAACYAALAGCRQGVDFPPVDGGCAALRRQALAWLRADLALLARQAADGNRRDRADTVAALHHWQADSDLIGVRHPWELLRLPEAERHDWCTLWADVAALLREARDAK
jgi:hypothetical protein